MNQNYYRCYKQQRHVHEFEGSTAFALDGLLRHNHRFAGITGEAIPCRGSHIHKIITNTDYTNHYHRICIYTGPAIYIGEGKHIHVVRGITTFDANHTHQFIFSTLIQAPTIICRPPRGKCNYYGTENRDRCNYYGTGENTQFNEPFNEQFDGPL